MAKLTVNGQKVTVDDSFLSLSPDEQHAAVDEIASHLGAPAAQGSPDQSSAPSDAKPGFFNSMARALRRAIPFGDRFVAAEKTIAPEWMSGTGKDYATNLENERAADQQLVKDHPFLAGSGQAIGGLALPIGAAGAAAQGASLGSKALLGMATGGGLGAVQGLSDAPDLTDGKDATKHAAQGALIGAGIGGAIPVAGRAIGGAYRGIADALTPIEGNMSRSARTALTDALRADGVSVAQSEANRLGDSAMLADLGPALLGKAQGVTLNSDDARSIMTNALRSRNQGTNARLTDDINSTLGPAVPPSAVEAQLSAKQAATGPRYEAALNGTPAVDITPARQQLENALLYAKGSDARRLNNAGQLLEMPGPGGRPIPEYDPRALHRAKMEMDAQIAQTENQTGSAAHTATRDLVGVRSSLNNAMEDQVPGYADANLTFATAARAKDALGEGQRILSPNVHPHDQSQMFGGLPLEGQAAYRQGARAAVDQAVGNKANDLVALKGVIKGEGDWNREKLTTAFGQQPTDALIGAVEREGRFGDTYNKIVENSQTAQRQAAARSMKPEPSSETPFINPNSTIPGMVGTAAKKALVSAIGAATRTDPTKHYAEIASALSAQGPERDATLSALARALSQWDANAAKAPVIGDRAALAAALIGNAGLRGRSSEQRNRSLP